MPVCIDHAASASVLHIAAYAFSVAVAAGVIGLDRTAAGQFMISQPIVAGPLAGLLLGDFTAGCIIGLTVELVWVLDLPVGTFVPADTTVITIASVGIAAFAGTGAGLSAIGFSILFTLLMVPVAMRADQLVRNANGRIVGALLNRPVKHTSESLGPAQVAGLAMFFLKSFALAFVFTALGVIAYGYATELPHEFFAAAGLLVKMLPLAGVALAARKLSMRTFDPHLIAGFVVAAFAGYAVHLAPVAVILLVMVAGGGVLLYHERRTH
jgi:mannose/fructose/N-acetylgalactosamine-specific phosphotransferase system component IIC